MLEKSQFTKLSPCQTFPLYGTVLFVYIYISYIKDGYGQFVVNQYLLTFVITWLSKYVISLGEE